MSEFGKRLIKATKEARAIATDLKVLDAHVITPDEYEEMPEWTDEQIATAVLHKGMESR